jgi:hypothetical protein
MRNNQSRLDLWKNAKFLCTPFTGTSDLAEEDRKILDNLFQKRKNYYKKSGQEYPEASPFEMIESSKELIFELVDNKIIIHFIVYSINIKRGEIEASELIYAPIDGTEEENNESIKTILALAHIYEVPVYPNTDEIAPLLSQYYLNLMTEGFALGDKFKNLKLIKSIGEKIQNINFKSDIKLNLPIQPAELSLIKKQVIEELERRDEAGKVLANLKLAISEVETLLKLDARNENALQTALTQNPILFGVEYVRIKPKQTLGSDYEMDYALERVSGLFDLVEIESSNLKIFTQKGNPTKHLVHAEQQIIDWLTWIEKHNSYIREKLPGITKPRGYVIIGRSKDLSSNDLERLNRRNLLFRDTLEIMTYDVLLEKAKNLLDILSGNHKSFI